MKTLEQNLIQSCPSMKAKMLKLLDESYKKKCEEVKATQINKFSKLLDDQIGKMTNNKFTMRASEIIKIISSVQLTPAEEKVLSLGMKYALPKKSLINDNIEKIMQIERGLTRDKDSEDGDKNCVRREFAKILNKHPWHNDEEQKHRIISKTLQNIANKKNIIVVKADKGNATVIMDTKEYDTKINAMLSPFPYKKITKDPKLILNKLFNFSSF